MTTVLDRSYNMGNFSREQCETYFGLIYNSLLKTKGWGWQWGFESIALYNSKAIIISRRLINDYPWRVKRTFLHEVAHALTPENLPPHGKEWAQTWGKLIQDYLAIGE